MATADVAAKSQDRHGRSKLFSWMKRLTRAKSASKKQSNEISPSKGNRPVHELSTYTQKKDLAAPTGEVGSDTPQAHSRSVDTCQGPHKSNQSITPTVDTSAGTTTSDIVLSDGDRHSKAGASQTTGGMSSASGGGGNSIFSSSNHSSRSLATTLTTIQSASANGALAGNQAPNPAGGVAHSADPAPNGVVASAVPPHLNPHVPTTYRSATANNLLSDNASVLTLASSSHRPQRRNSLDTNASIRAIAPSSVWGGSRESLPLSVLSQQQNDSWASSLPPTAGLHASGRSVSGLSVSERPSAYPSGVGVGAPVLSSERNSIYAGRTVGADGSSIKASSIKSGFLGHSRNDSTAGSIGTYSSPLAGTKDTDGEKTA